MNAEKRKRVPSPDWKKASGRVRQNEMVAIAKEYQKRLQKERSEDILRDLSSRYGKESRTIQRYVSRGKELIAEKEQQQPKETTLDPRLIKHLDELAETADILAHHVQRLIHYKGDDDIEAMGDVLGHLMFWRKSNGTIVCEGIDPTEEFEYENQHPVDTHLARWLYTHYEHRFDKPPFNEWNQLSMGNVTCKIVDNLQFLAHGGLKPCRNCPICKEIADGQLNTGRIQH